MSLVLIVYIVARRLMASRLTGLHRRDAYATTYQN
jgi:hypothetical protein